MAMFEAEQHQIETVILDSNWLESQVAELSPPSAASIFIEAVLPAVITATGVVGNLFTIAVYCRRTLCSSANYFLISLLSVDVLLLLAYFFTSAFWTMYFNGNVRSYGNHTIGVHMAYVTCNIFMTASVWFTILLTVERYMAICYPFRHHLQQAKRNRIWLSIVSVVVLSLLYNFLKIFELEREEVSLFELLSPIATSLQADSNNSTIFIIKNETVYILSPSANTRESVYFIAYRLICRSVFDTIVPVVIIACLTFLMCRTLFMANKKRHFYLRHSCDSCSTIYMQLNATLTSENRSVVSAQSSKDSSYREGRNQERIFDHVETISSNEDMLSHYKQPAVRHQASLKRLNVPLLIVLVKFVLSHVLPAVVTILEMVETDATFHEVRFNTLVVITNLFVVANSATNCVVFLLCTRKVRREVRALFCDLISWLRCNAT